MNGREGLSKLGYYYSNAMSVSRDGGGEGNATNDQVTVKTGEVAAGTNLAPEKGADLPISTHQNEVFRIYGADIAHASYGNNSTVVTEAAIFGPKAAVESDFEEGASRPINPMYEVTFDDLLAALEWDVYVDNTEGIGHISMNEYCPVKNEGVVIDYPLGEIWQAVQADASATDTHVWADVTFVGEVVEVSEEYNLQLLRSSLDKWMG